MLETDCIIPRHVPIPHDGVYTLYGNARAVEQLQKQGLTAWQIRLKLHIGLEAYQEAEYEIKKKKRSWRSLRRKTWKRHAQD